MSEVTKVVTAQRYAQGFTYESYLNSIGENRARFTPHETAFKLVPADAKAFQDIVKRTGGIKVLAIGEDWCPDVHRGLPIMNSITQASGMELRFFPRDKNLDIINLFLKEGKYQSIPVFAFFDKDLGPLCHWIERPDSATRAMAEIRAELAKQKLSEEETRQAMRQKQAPLVDSFRQATVTELKELLAQATQKRST
ncbi:MAG: thioredoxin family protein [Chloroflexi bacterium]|nr:thioredoxin family protein [Chloroflexota bacterium]